LLEKTATRGDKTTTNSQRSNSDTAFINYMENPGSHANQEGRGGSALWQKHVLYV